MHKPMSEAVWRIYHRFGKKNPRFSKSAWTSVLTASKQFERYGRFAVSKGITSYNGNECAEFGDMRRIGSRRDKEGFLICRENNEAVVYASDEDGVLSKLEMMY